jgi:hypothetical protein
MNVRICIYCNIAWERARRPFVGCLLVGHEVECVGVGDGRIFGRKSWETFRDTFKAFVLYIKRCFEDVKTVFI